MLKYLNLPRSGWMHGKVFTIVGYSYVVLCLLQATKQSSSLRLIQFEGAPVMMQPYERHHIFESSAFMLEEVKNVSFQLLHGLW